LVRLGRKQRQGGRAISLTITGKIAWLVLAIGWYVLRYPFERRANRASIAVDQKKLPERIRLTVSLIGLGVLPLLYVVSGVPHFGSYRPVWPAFVLGLVALAAALALFRLTHKALGQMWSVSLQLKRDHRLVTTGIYRRIRHPMYSAFWLMAVAQTLLLPNWVAGPAGLIGFGFLFFSRVWPEEQLMEATFGDEYRAYVARTKRVIPFIY
jgi:protein-S-isoprenylcysteine O-methyltransferase Ste14